MSIIAETERLILRTWLLNDLKDYFEIYGDPEVWRYVEPGGYFKDEGEARRSLQRTIAYQQAHGICHWAAVEKNRGRVIGACGFNLFAGGPDLELVYHFARAYWGRGYATEAVGACLRYARENLAAPRVVASTLPQNSASQRVLEKAGFAYEGMKQRESGEEKLYALVLPAEVL